jgi:hypothetical protein
MAGNYIDPAESFSRALGQGLGVFKSYRDEARLDEDRARREEDRQLNRRLLLENEARVKNDFDYQVGRRGTQDKLDDQAVRQGENALTIQEQQIERGAFDIGNMEKDREFRMSQAAAQTRASETSANASMMNAVTNRRQVDAEIESRQMRQSFSQLIYSLRSGDYSGIAGNSGAALGALELAAAANGAPALMEAMENPYGDWQDDPEKRRQVFSFWGSGRSMPRLEGNLGFGSGTVRIERVAEDPNNPNRARVTFSGVDTRDGSSKGQRVERDGFVSTDKLFERGNVSARIFRQISNDPNAIQSLVASYAAADPQSYRALVDREIENREAMIDEMYTTNVGGRRVYRETGSDSETMQSVENNLRAEIQALRTGGRDSIPILFSRMSAVGGSR